MAGADSTCAHCGSPLRANAPFCSACGQPVTNRQQVLHDQHAVVLPPVPTAPVGVERAGRGIRCACALLDLAAMLSPTLPLAIAAAILGVGEVVYIVAPVALAAVWLWMQIWQGYTGMSFGKAMLGLRLVTAVGHNVPHVSATLTRAGVFGGTAGFAALPVLLSAVPADGMHDRISALAVIDVVRGANPLGARPTAVLRRSAGNGPGLNKVQSPFNMSGRR
ncbi:RDD domain-containing protein [Mycobacteroides abscessus subsp. abscessus]|nr:RDD domain-containing protein [Mycobacteroides abscessus subsp. abscessus]